MHNICGETCGYRAKASRRDSYYGPSARSDRGVSTGRRTPRGAPHQLAPGLDRRGSFMRPCPLGELTNDVRRPADRLSRDGWPLHGRPCWRLIRSFMPRTKTRKLRHLSGGCACRALRPFPVPHPAAFRVHTRSSWHRPRPTAGIDHAPLFSDAPGILRVCTSNPPHRSGERMDRDPGSWRPVGARGSQLGGCESRALTPRQIAPARETNDPSDGMSAGHLVSGVSPAISSHRGQPRRCQSGTSVGRLSPLPLRGCLSP